MREFSFEKWIVYNQARTLVKDVYLLLNGFPNTEKFALCDQIRRAVVSVPSNIAEQSGRTSKKEKIHFLEIAYGSLMETYCQLQIAADLKYISEEQLASLKDKFFEISRMINGLSNSFKDEK